MKRRTQHNGFAIALAWPQTCCKQTGAWYDIITRYLRISKNHYYKFGHAALLLINREKSKCHYFDFGRYHAPFQFGRVRNAKTDHDLRIKITPIISDDRKTILNLKDILLDLQENASCHGDGILYASYTEINFTNAWKKAIQMQKSGSIPYGPFQLGGSNCSRFVNDVIYEGTNSWKTKLKLKYFVPLTPTPMSNIYALSKKLSIPKISDKPDYSPVNKTSKKGLRSTLHPPSIKPDIHDKAQWLSGEGAGSWFDIRPFGQYLRVTRFSPSGKKECSGLYKSKMDSNFQLNDDVKITYPSNCMVISLICCDDQYRFERV